MKKSSVLFSLVITILLISCGGQNNYEQYGQEYQETNLNGGYNIQIGAEAQSDTYQNMPAGGSNAQPKQQKRSAGKANIIQHNIKTAQGQVFASIPLPANWKVNPNNKEAHIQGPNGIKILELAAPLQAYHTDPSMVQILQYSGQPNNKPIGMNDVLNNYIIPNAEKEGAKLIKKYEMPEVARKNKADADVYYKYAPTQDSYQTIATEWAEKNGNKAWIIVTYKESKSMGMIMWNYTAQYLSAAPEDFESAKQTYLYGYLNKQLNPSYIAAYNQKERQKLQASDARFQANQRQKQAAFNAQQQAHRQNADAMRQASMDSYNQRMNAMDESNRQFNNMMYDENTMYNHADGKTYQVESGYNNTWMNSNGDAIQTQDYNYNPNLDNNYNNYDWQQAQDVDAYPY